MENEDIHSLSGYTNSGQYTQNSSKVGYRSQDQNSEDGFNWSSERSFSLQSNESSSVEDLPFGEQMVNQNDKLENDTQESLLKNINITLNDSIEYRKEVTIIQDIQSETNLVLVSEGDTILQENVVKWTDRFKAKCKKIFHPKGTVITKVPISEYNNIDEISVKEEKKVPMDPISHTINEGPQSRVLTSIPSIANHKEYLFLLQEFSMEQQVHGVPTSVSISTNHGMICIGTSKGYLITRSFSAIASPAYSKSWKYCNKNELSTQSDSKSSALSSTVIYIKVSTNYQPITKIVIMELDSSSSSGLPPTTPLSVEPYVEQHISPPEYSPMEDVNLFPEHVEKEYNTGASSLFFILACSGDASTRLISLREVDSGSTTELLMDVIQILNHPSVPVSVCIRPLYSESNEYQFSPKSNKDDTNYFPVRYIISVSCFSGLLYLFSLDKRERDLDPQLYLINSIRLPKRLSSVSISPYNSLISVGTQDGTILVFSIPSLGTKCEFDCKNRQGKDRYGRKVVGIEWLDGDEYGCMLITSADSRLRILDLRDPSRRQKFKHYNFRNPNMSNEAFFVYSHNIATNESQIKSRNNLEKPHVAICGENGEFYLWKQCDQYHRSISGTTNQNPQLVVDILPNVAQVSYPFVLTEENLVPESLPSKSLEGNISIHTPSLISGSNRTEHPTNVITTTRERERRSDIPVITCSWNGVVGSLVHNHVYASIVRKDSKVMCTCTWGGIVKIICLMFT